ncbi:hypothetical protein HU200_011434 [Digitaria exilis]|uniref:Uncharacterized protein n=1 Tax=Digitaria exilis TaxID=1010633 RepID=A0A835KP30_9POAL|nr:hypothetical protein HU200_011434 [Digitaria exilis]
MLRRDLVAPDLMARLRRIQARRLPLPSCSLPFLLQTELDLKLPHGGCTPFPLDPCYSPRIRRSPRWKILLEEWKRGQCDICLRGRFDASGKRAHYVILPIATKDDWAFYKDVVKGSQVSVAEIVVDLCNHGIYKHGQDQEDDDEPMEHLTQEQVRMQGDMNEVEEGDVDDENDDLSGQGRGSSGDDDDFDRCRDNNNFGNLETIDVEVPEVPIFHSIPSKAYYDSGLRLNPMETDSGEQVIEKGMRYGLDLFLMIVRNGGSQRLGNRTRVGLQLYHRSTPSARHAKAERTFDLRLRKLKELMNEDATEWLEQHMDNKSKWVLAFDDGSRYGTCNTNVYEVLNKVLKGIRSLPMMMAFRKRKTEDPLNESSVDAVVPPALPVPNCKCGKPAEVKQSRW